MGRDEQAFAVKDAAPVGTAELQAAPSLASPTLALLALSACGGGGGGGSPTPPPTSAPPVTTIPVRTPTATEASRFLSQATMGATRASISRVSSMGYESWLNEQFATRRSVSHYDWLVLAGYSVPANMNGTAGFDPAMWRQLIAGEDQLRQRVGMALLDFLVVGIDGINSNWRQFAAAAYADILWDNAFGNYRTLLERISTNAAMGYFLTFLGNRKANPATGAAPDENYARELLQLFTIGLVRLNRDGTVQMNGSRPAETYTQDDITGLARVFTGYVLDSNDNTTPERLRRPMVVNAGQHETGAKTFLGTSIPAGTSGAESLKMALDAIFAHPNVPPFVSRQLIQRLVTSNPSPAYVGRVAAVFENNGSNVRGDLMATVRAILLDEEARDGMGLISRSFGKLREPVMRLTGWARAFQAGSPSEAWAIGDTSSSATRLGQSPGRSPSVFNFFRPGYTPPNSPISTQGLVAPEFQITNEPSVIAYVNYMQALIVNGAGDFRATYTDILTKAADSAALVDDVDQLLGAYLTIQTRDSIRTAVDSIAPSAANGPINRVYTAILLTLASPEYLVQK
jgi:uncharacterized protein (DUF1800 family)